MPETYLQTAYKDRELVKGLGARWDAARKQWYVPDGRDLAPFVTWLPAEYQAAKSALENAGTSVSTGGSTELALPTKGISLSQLLAGVAQAVAQAYRVGEWVRVEVVKADVRRGHVYLELAERSPAGDSLAQARAMIWADTANQIVPEFERATGVVLGAGIKLLLRAKPALSPQYGLSLVVDAIDPDYTLGDLEAKKREIRARLQREGLNELNRSLPAPWDFNAVLVVAPQGAAGLGDFQAEADRLQRWGLCRFVIVHSRFQGDGSAAEVRQALLHGLASWQDLGQQQPDAVVVIRGGGAVNDLAWLNDYDLARCICELPVPVLTGIGHERDRSVLDEVAHASYDTPSKVIAAIEQLIVKRALDARANHDAIIQIAEQAVHRARRDVEQSHVGIRAAALLALRDGREQAALQFQAIRHDSLLKLQQARHAVPAAMTEIAAQARQTLHEARQGADQHHASVIERAAQQAALARDRTQQALDQVAEAARRQVLDAQTRAEATIREIAGQGPEKTLGRGFAVVRAEDGTTITGASAAREAGDLQIEFRDGRLPARVRTEARTDKT
jgi:exodeoxyribonuclease VII large subunit